jgi:hypothetical protein
MASLFGAFPFLIKLYADGGYQGRSSRARSNGFLRASTSRSSSGRVKPQASSRSQSAGSSNAHSLGSAAADDWTRTGNASTTRRSPSSASLQSVSCCENYAIPHDVLGQTVRTKRLAVNSSRPGCAVGGKSRPSSDSLAAPTEDCEATSARKARVPTWAMRSSAK